MIAWIENSLILVSQSVGQSISRWPISQSVIRPVWLSFCPSVLGQAACLLSSQRKANCNQLNKTSTVRSKHTDITQLLIVNSCHKGVSLIWNLGLLLTRLKSLRKLAPSMLLWVGTRSNTFPFSSSISISSLKSLPPSLIPKLKCLGWKKVNCMRKYIGFFWFFSFL